MQLPVKPLLTTLLLGTAALAAAQEQTQQQLWYQVDVILFKPVNSDLDDESWPDFEPQYPADVTAITPPRVFNLSQLEQAAASAVVIETPAQDEPATAFAFSSRSNSATNRFIVESLTRTEASTEVAAGEGFEDVSVEAAAEEAAPAGESDSASLSAELPGGAAAATADSGVPASDTDTTGSDDLLLPPPDPGSAGTLAFNRVDDVSSLISTLRSLRRSSRYEVLDSYSWIQPIDNEQTPIMIQAGDRFDDRFELEGTLAFSRSRYLHVAADLWYTTFENRGMGTTPFASDVISTLDTEVLADYEDLVAVERRRGQYAPARTHRMSQSRRMRSSEVHYLDHPLFGVIVRINRYELPASGEE